MPAGLKPRLPGQPAVVGHEAVALLMQPWATLIRQQMAEAWPRVLADDFSFINMSDRQCENAMLAMNFKLEYTTDQHKVRWDTDRLVQGTLSGTNRNEFLTSLETQVETHYTELRASQLHARGLTVSQNTVGFEPRVLRIAQELLHNSAAVLGRLARAPYKKIA